MNSGDRFDQEIACAEAYIKDAARLWGSGAITGYEDSCSLFRTAVEAMESAQQVAASSQISTGEALTRLGQLRTEIARTVRLVDASAAFWNGLALRVDAGFGPVESRGGAPASYREA